MKRSLLLGIMAYCSAGCVRLWAQPTDSVKLNIRKIFSLCLDSDITSALTLVEPDTTKKISRRDLRFIREFSKRFKYDKDLSTYLTERSSPIDGVLEIFRDYWRSSLLDTSKNNDDSLWISLGLYLSERYPTLKKNYTIPDSVDSYLKKYVHDNGLHMTDGTGKTGRLYDLLVWCDQKDTVYTFRIHSETISARVILMDSFITLGWEEYATLGKLYPGGWATPDALYCVKKGYDLASEDFLVSYLAHESRHFADYKLFPGLKSADLEYRGKLTELSLAKTTLFKLIAFFIDNANKTSQNGHNVANYRVINDLSKKIFNTEFENDKNRWMKVKSETINEAALKVLEENTKLLKKK